MLIYHDAIVDKMIIQLHPSQSITILVVDNTIHTQYRFYNYTISSKLKSKFCLTI